MKAKTNCYRLLSMMLCLVLCLSLMPTAAFAEGEPTYINEVTATATITAPKYGEAPVSPELTLVTGSPVKLTGKGWWKKDGTEWKSYGKSTFTDGTYRYEVELRTETADYQITNDTTFSVNGTAWTASGFFENHYSSGYGYRYFASPEYTVKSGAEVAHKIEVTAHEEVTWELSSESAMKGETITLQITPNEGFELSTLTIKAGGDEISPSSAGNTYSFTMPETDVAIDIQVKYTGEYHNIEVVELSSNIAAPIEGAHRTNLFLSVESGSPAYAYNIGLEKLDGGSWKSYGEDTFTAGTYRFDFRVGTKSYSERISEDTVVKVNGVTVEKDGQPLDNHYSNGYGSQGYVGGTFTCEPKTAGTHTVAFEAFYCEGPATQVVNDGEPAVLPAAPTMEGHSFEGWTAERKGSAKFDFNTPITEDIILYACWSDVPAGSYAVTFNMGGHGTQIHSQIVKSGKTAAKPTEPTASGYTFGGWYTDSKLTTAFDFTKAITANTTIYAKWTEGTTPTTYTVTFEANGGTCGTTTMTTDADGKLASLPTATWTNLEFVGWFKPKTGSKITTDTVFTEDTTIGAMWKISNATFSMTKPEAGKKVSECKDISFTTPAFTKDTDWTFVFDNPTWYEKGNDTPLADDVVFEAGKTYVFNTGGIRMTNYSWVVWSESPAPKGTLFGQTVSGAVDPAQAYADFNFEVTIPANYTVTFDMNGHGTQIAAQTVEEGKTATKPTDPTESGWTFGGWYADSTFNVAFDFTKAITVNTTVYAKWTEETPAPTNYTVTFNMNGHGTQIAAQTVESGKTAVKPADPAASGWTFGGWYADSTFNVAFDFTKAITANTTVYAKWTEDAPAPTKYTVTFNMNGHGAAPEAQTVESGNTATKPADPAESGWAFCGWYADSTLNVAFDFTKAITANTTVYAKWTENTPAAEFSYDAVSGADGTWTKNSGKDYTLTIKRSVNDETCYSHFDSVEIDGKALTAGTDYDSKAGSTVITLKASVLQKLPDGKHTVTVNFDDGKVTTNLTVKAASGNGGQDVSPKTGDNSHTGLWIALMFTSFIGLGGVTVFGRKRKESR